MAFMQDYKSRSVSRSAVVLLRIFLGALFLQQGLDKVAMGNAGLGFEPALVNFVAVAVERGYAFYTPFLESVVLPNASIFALLITWTELFVGVSLVLGFLNRYGAFMAMFLALNLALSQGMGLISPTVEAMTVWVAFTLMITAAGRSWGLDSVFHNRWPRSVLW